MHAVHGYELVDFGGGGRLERFGDRMVDRPHPGALGERRAPSAWASAELRFDRDRGWTGTVAVDRPWSIEVVGLTLELRATEAGQVGLFPEHLAMLPWLRDRLDGRTSSGPVEGKATPAVLHLFAYTGVTTLALAEAGAAVTHVDSARPTVAWARRNADASGLADRPIRWIVDDAPAFARREARRGRRYDGLVLDPPTYGHGRAGRPWQLAEHLAGLLDTCAALLEPDAFVLLTAHTPGIDGDRLASMLARVQPRSSGPIEHGDLFVEAGDGRRLVLGAFARWAAGAS